MLEIIFAGVEYFNEQEGISGYDQRAQFIHFLSCSRSTKLENLFILKVYTFKIINTRIYAGIINVLCFCGFFFFNGIIFFHYLKNILLNMKKITDFEYMQIRQGNYYISKLQFILKIIYSWLITNIPAFMVTLKTAFSEDTQKIVLFQKEFSSAVFSENQHL